MKAIHPFQAILAAPFGMLGISCTEDALTGIEFLARDAQPQTPICAMAQTACVQLAAYLNNPDFRFDLPLKLDGTDHQGRVWRAMSAIPRGQTRQYGELAREIASSPRAVGQACGANPIPIVIPCHRVVSKTGIGGFAHYREGYTLDIKHWLLNHEQR